MRLTKLKLAGFKSFVEPTMVALPGQLVAVVGPNGCGKSNIIDAVRWVLGESKASALRGESMQDVIFNGSTNRQPVGRASVELVFDNSLGRAAGQWSQYAELSVKRVLTRNGVSSYFINNLQVRRRDITDLFLGTGLGARAYAIIEQGMISRIIEAKPDELRVFLEEAAGVTRYKERRHETEGRIADTRENLTRVEDILRELDSQMERLESQAEVARQYHDHQTALTRSQHLLWFHRRNEARAEVQRIAREIEAATNRLEAETAALRETESRLESARSANYDMGDALSRAQNALYEANSEVSRLESDLRHRRENRHRLQARLEQLHRDEAQWSEQAARQEEEETRWQSLHEAAQQRLEIAEARSEQQSDSLPVAEEAVSEAQADYEEQRRRVADVEQAIRVDEAHRANAQRSLENIAQRRARLEQEQATLVAPDLAEFEEKRAAEAAQEEELGVQQARLADLQDELPAAEEAQRGAQSALQSLRHERSQTEARLAALDQLQKRVQGSGRLGEWLKRHRLAERLPLWKRLHVEAGWEDAVEAVLRERLNAVSADPDAVLAALASDAPGAKVALLLSGQAAAPDAVAPDSLFSRVRCEDGDILPLLQTWLGPVRIVEDLAAALSRRGELASGQYFISRAGHMVWPGAVQLFAPDAEGHGLLERQREIETLAQKLEAQGEAVAGAEARLEEAAETLSGMQETLAQARREAAAMQQRLHTMHVETLKLSQAHERHRERETQLAQALAELDREAGSERQRQAEADEAMAAGRERLFKLQQFLGAARDRVAAAERVLREQRDGAQRADRELQEVRFSLRECETKLAEIGNNRIMAAQQVERAATEREAVEAQLAEFGEDSLDEQLQRALEARSTREASLAAARDAAESAAGGLRELEEQRLRVEQGLHPLRERINEFRLKEQAAQINAEQNEALLAEAQADEVALTELLPQARPGALQAEISRLQKAIADLGPVNLAALQELESSRERKGFLDAQHMDLSQALETLENAIRRIDRETRELLQQTFDTVNGHFGRLFPQLFGGGEARLIMSGEEILDAGVQVMAQPPGKKNSTIHLLSGGEKALTAISLVFSLFQLNPAPFCLLDEVDAPLDDTNTERFCEMVKRMSEYTQFLYISHNKITMEMAKQLVGVTMQESGVSRVVEVDIEEALRMREQQVA